MGKVLVGAIVVHAAGLLSDGAAVGNSWMIVVAVALVVVGIAAFFLGRRKKSDTET